MCEWASECESVCMHHHEDLDVFTGFDFFGFNESWSARSEDSHSKGMVSFWQSFKICLFCKIDLTNHILCWKYPLILSIYNTEV